MGPVARFLADEYGRRFPYLRLSVTEVCNFRCTYCLPNGWQATPDRSFLRPDEAGRLVRGFVALGLKKVRLTGGEPTVRKDIAAFLERLSAEPAIRTRALTTNGWNLARHFRAWQAAGLNHLNVSLDALRADQFYAITGHDRFDDVMRGIDTALEHDCPTVKVNAVLLRSCQEEGFTDWAEFVRTRPISVRFIELMRTADNADFFRENHVSGARVREWLSERGWLPVVRTEDAGPATDFLHPDYAGRIGLIAPYSRGFCEGCNRLRVTARGVLRLCLFGEGGADLRPLLQSDTDQSALEAEIVSALRLKPKEHALHTQNPGDARNLSQMGG